MKIAGIKTETSKIIFYTQDFGKPPRSKVLALGIQSKFTERFSLYLEFKLHLSISDIAYTAEYKQ